MRYAGTESVCGMEIEMIKKIVMFTKGIETLWFFSEQMGKTFELLGYDVFYFDQCTEYRSLSDLIWFCEPGVTAAISFNFDGCSGEEYFIDAEGISFFDARDVLFINIVVDHPFYYHKFLPYLPKRYIQVSIDREHDRYLQRFFPKMERGPFMPLGGTSLWSKDTLPGWEKRDYDIVFTGNYNPPSMFEKTIRRNGDEYAEFYYDIIRDLVKHPWKSMDATIIEHLNRDVEDINEEGIRDTMPNMIFIDLYVRHYFRGEVVKTLVDNGFKVHCFGAGWKMLECRHPENIIDGDVLDSLGCLQQISHSKLSMNVMPWFKEGAHDRVFNSMLNGAVCVSDDSKYLDEILKDGKDYIRYELANLEKLPERVEEVLNDRDKWESIAQSGYRLASKNHTWADRARFLHSQILCKIP
jgi:hypothetical protein